MLAFLDSPIQLIIAAVVILVVFGPQKLPEIAGQIGRALRELKRTTSELQDSLTLDQHRYDEHYNPPSYDTYGNPTTSADTASVPEADVWQSSSQTTTHAAITSGEPVHGDFAASAMSDAGSEYGMGMSAPDSAHGGASAYDTPSYAAASGVAATTGADVHVRPAEGNVPRQS